MYYYLQKLSCPITCWFRFNEDVGSKVRENHIVQSCMSRMNINSSESVSLDSLKALVGEERLKRICAKPEIQVDFSALESNPTLLTNETTQKIFWGIGDVRLEDLEECSNNLKQKSIIDLSPEELKEVYLSLLPFYEESLDYDAISPIEYFDKSKASGKGFIGLKERVWTIVGMAKDCLTVEKDTLTEDMLLAKQMKEFETLASRLADRELPKGTILCLNQGLFVVDEIFAGGGAFVSVLKELNNNHALILCRGTAFRKTAESGYLSAYNDIQSEIGLLGITSIWPKLLPYLTQKNYESIDIYGKSLGGGHAQYLTGLIGGLESIKIRSLLTLGSVGVPESVHQLYERVFQNKERPAIKRILNWGDNVRHHIDYIPEFGGRHLSQKPGNAIVYHLIPADSEDEQMQVIVDRIPQHYFFTLAIKLISSFSGAHIRQTTMRSFKVRVVESEQQHHVPSNSLAETARKFFAATINCFSFGYLGTTSFENFYQNLVSQE